MTIGSVAAGLGTRAVGRAFSPHFWNFSPIPARKPLAKRCRVPPNTETDSQPGEPRPPCAKVRGQVRVNVLCPTPGSPPSTPLPVLCRRGGRCRQPLPSAALAAPPAGACAGLSLHFQPGYMAHTGLAQPGCYRSLSVGFLPAVATAGCCCSCLSHCLHHHAACSHASPSKLFELFCKILLILQIFLRDRISLGH